MNIRGLFKTSLVDYPGRISSVIFTGGCNLRCGYCHNPALALNSFYLDKIEERDVLSFLEKRKGLIDGVTISGGEPTMNRGLIPFIQKVKILGLDVKLDTNGFFPRVVADCLEKGLVSYFAVDVKTSPDKYRSLTERDVNFDDLISTINIIKNSDVEYEIRTTCVPGFVTVDDIKKIGESIGQVKRYYLQQFVNRDMLLDRAVRELHPYTADYLLLLKAEAENFSDFCSIRGI